MNIEKLTDGLIETLKESDPELILQAEAVIEDIESQLKTLKERKAFLLALRIFVPDLNEKARIPAMLLTILLEKKINDHENNIKRAVDNNIDNTIEY